MNVHMHAQNLMGTESRERLTLRIMEMSELVGDGVRG